MTQPVVATSHLAQMKQFLLETNAMSLALGVVIGGAVGKLITSLVAGLIMPLVTLALPSGDWRAWAVPVGSQKLAVGDVMGAAIDFLIIAIVVFVVASKLLKIEVKK